MADENSGAPVSDEAAVADEMAVATDYAAYQPTAYQDGSQGQTPITAASLNKSEQGLAAASAQVVELRDSVSRRVYTYGGVTKSGVGAVVREDNPQVITLEVESTAGSYTLIVTKRGIALWDGKANKQLWGINA